MKKVVFVCCILANSILMAQSLSSMVVNSAGTSVASVDGKYRLDFSVGEAVITYQESGGKNLSQGFIQPIAFNYAKATELNYLELLNLYPNPTSSILYLDFLEKSSETVQIEVLDCNSRMLKRLNTDSNATIPIDVSDLPSQLYYLKVQMKDKVFYEKVIMQK